MGCKLPIRIELFDDSIDSLRTFDPDSQRTVEKINQLTILPAQEYAFDEAAISHFRQAWRSCFAGNPLDCPSYEAISEGRHCAGIEMYLPLFFSETASFMDYLPEKTQIIQYGSLTTSAQQFGQEVDHRYEQYRIDQSRTL